MSSMSLESNDGNENHPAPFCHQHIYSAGPKVSKKYSKKGLKKVTELKKVLKKVMKLKKGLKKVNSLKKALKKVMNSKK